MRFPILILGILFAAAHAMLAQPKPAGQTTVPLEAKAAVFSDNARFVFDEVPAALRGKPFLPVAMQKGASLEIEGDGYLYVITAQKGHGHSQEATLVAQGFKAVTFVHTGRIWTGLPKGWKLQLFEKKTSGTATLTFKTWAVPVFSEERIVFEPASAPSAPQVAAVATVEPEAGNETPRPAGESTKGLQAGVPVFTDTARFVFDDVPAPLRGKRFLPVAMQKPVSLKIEGAGYIYVITAQKGHAHSQEATLTGQGFKAVPFAHSQKIWSGLPAGWKLQLFEKPVKDGEAVSFKTWGVPVFSPTRIVFEGEAQLPASAPDSPATKPQARSEAWWQARHQAKLAEAKAAEGIELVLLGDSLTQRWETDGQEAYAGLTARFRTLNLGFSGDRTQHVLWRIREGELDGLNPRKLVLLIGTNNLPPNRSTPEETVAGVAAVLADVRAKLPRTEVLLLGILPRGHAADDSIRAAVRQTNAGLKLLAEAQSIEFQDLSALFSDPTTGVPLANLMPDHLHLNAEGYQLLAGALTAFLAR